MKYTSKGRGKGAAAKVVKHTGGVKVETGGVNPQMGYKCLPTATTPKQQSTKQSRNK